MWRFKQKVIQAVFEIGNCFWIHVNFGGIYIEQFHVNKLIKAEIERFLENYIYIYIYIYILYILYKTTSILHWNFTSKQKLFSHSYYHPLIPLIFLEYISGHFSPQPIYSGRVVSRFLKKKTPSFQ